MRQLLLFLFLAYPMLEIALMIKVGGMIGIWPTLAIVIATGLAGVLVLSRHGPAHLRRMSETIAEGHPPVEAALHGALVGFAGLLLIAPGLITDVLGLMLLIAPVRRLMIQRFAHHLHILARQPVSDSATPRAPRQTPRGGRARRPAPGPIIIDGEFERLDERPAGPTRSDDPSTKPGKSGSS